KKYCVVLVAVWVERVRGSVRFIQSFRDMHGTKLKSEQKNSKLKRF
ncbi:jg4160, partial [Pararge aegeria aegeria]